MKVKIKELKEKKVILIRLLVLIEILLSFIRLHISTNQNITMKNVEGLAF